MKCWTPIVHLVRRQNGLSSFGAQLSHYAWGAFARPGWDSGMSRPEPPVADRRKFVAVLAAARCGCSWRRATTPASPRSVTGIRAASTAVSLPRQRTAGPRPVLRRGLPPLAVNAGRDRGGGAHEQYRSTWCASSRLQAAPGNRPVLGAFCLLAKCAGFSVEAIEMDPACCGFLASRIGVRAICSSDEAVALDEATEPNVIVAWHVLEHLRDPWRLLDAAARRLARAGSLSWPCQTRTLFSSACSAGSGRMWTPLAICIWCLLEYCGDGLRQRGSNS